MIALVLALVAQDHGGHAMPDPHAGHKPDPHAGHVMPAAPASDPHAGHAMPAAPVYDQNAGHAMPAAPVSDPHAGHAMPAAPASGPHAGHAMPAAPREGTDLPAGTAPAPAPPLPHYADRIWGAAAMARGRDVMMQEDGGARTFGQIMLNLAEAQVRRGGDGYRWDGEGWFGGDINRLVLKSEGEGRTRGGVEAAEVQALYARAIGPYFNLQAGLRHDIRPTPRRTYLTLGAEGLAPYWFDVEAAAFVSTKGEVLGRIEGYYDQRVTQRLILQPRAELNLSAQRVRAIGLGSGPAQAELGLRLRYEFAREFAPYVGIAWERKLGGTARLARVAGEERGGAALALGIRAWF